ncbi:tyrosine-protein phosphatase [Oryzicola mucosus]|uniref:protein-tyrosine-phosphatase n=1 Tax=Oryzicola mucosus TaxID=2767425 RepID=A0A8J6PHC9_9HYPH|nr:CpsB/CapC family capsule biosynthesis tyrosine phosphatase [Oryzicola mucosus]MBD0413466.1 capsular biosynthesis protein [Oryzicola mucosus]
MIDLHSHILPGLDDGSPDLATSVEMARVAVADGITHMACTPHIVSGLYANDAHIIKRQVSLLQRALDAANVSLQLFTGADVHIAPDLVEKISRGTIPTLNGSRYFLFEPPHHVLPPRIEELAARLIQAHFVPIITHPERLGWIAENYVVIENLNRLGCLIQLTADSIVGNFGPLATYYCGRLLDEGRVDIIASDCHGPRIRSPNLSKARELLERKLGREESDRMVLSRPRSILLNEYLSPAGNMEKPAKYLAEKKTGLLKRLMGGGLS